MLYSLLTTALLIGLGGMLHCGAMCAAPCAAALPQGVPLQALLGRTLGYALLGALAAGATGVLAAWSRWADALQPLWVMLLAATVLLGGWMLLKGALPGALQDHGLRGYRRLQARLDDSGLLARHPALKGVVPLVLGMAWAALPCGLLYAAVTVAALAETPLAGALVMVVFSLPGAWVLWWMPRRLGPWAQRAPATSTTPDITPAVVPVLWQPMARQTPGPALAPAGAARFGTPASALAGQGGTPASSIISTLRSRLSDPRWAVRLSGLVLSATAGWALAHRLLVQWQAWCA